MPPWRTLKIFARSLALMLFQCVLERDAAVGLFHLLDARKSAVDDTIDCGLFNFAYEKAL